MIDKQTIFEEFKIAKQKDLQQSTTNEPYEDCFTNRLQLLKSHKDAKKSNPKMYRHLDINFDNLILAYSSPVPVDYFYNRIFGMSLQEYKYKEDVKRNKKAACPLGVAMLGIFVPVFIAIASLSN